MEAFVENEKNDLTEMSKVDDVSRERNISSEEE